MKRFRFVDYLTLTPVKPPTEEEKRLIQELKTIAADYGISIAGIRPEKEQG